MTLFQYNKDIIRQNITLKFNEFECGSIINAVKNRFAYDTFHKFDDNKTTIKFTPWDKQVKVSKFDASTKTYKEERPQKKYSQSSCKGDVKTIKVDATTIYYMYYIYIYSQFVMRE